MTTLNSADLIIRIQTPDNKMSANTFGTLAEIQDIVKFRIDSGMWDVQTITVRIQAMVQAYLDLNKLSWSRFYGQSQNRDYEYNLQYGAINDPPLELPEFLVAVKRAQACQAMFIMNGTQARDMAREGIRMTRALRGSEVEFLGYRGAVGGEAIECLGPWIERSPRTRRMGSPYRHR